MCALAYKNNLNKFSQQGGLQITEMYTTSHAVSMNII